MRTDFLILAITVLLFDAVKPVPNNDFRYIFYVTVVSGGLRVVADLPENCGLGGVLPCQIGTIAPYSIGMTIPSSDYHITLQTKP